MLTVFYAFREFRGDAGFERAAALAYKFLISLVPLLAVALALFVAFAPLQDYSAQVESFLFDALLPPGGFDSDEEASQSEVAGEGEGAGDEAAEEGLGEGTEVEVPAPVEAGQAPPTEDSTAPPAEGQRDRLLTSSEMREYLSEITRQLQTAKGELGLFGTLFLFVTTLSLFSTIEIAFNRVWKVKKRRSAVRKFQSFWSIVSLGPLLLGASLFLTGRLSQQEFLGPLADSPTAKVFRWMVPFLCSFIAIYLVYQFVPYTRVRVRAALIGAFVGATLWELGKLGFRYYMTQAVSFEQIYGALGTIPVLLLWLYLSWIVVLYGAEVAYVWQNLESVRSDGMRNRKMLGSLLPAALGLLAAIGERFRAGAAPVGLSALIEQTGCSDAEARHCLQLLASSRLVHRAEGGQAFVLAKPAAKIRLVDVAHALGEGAEDLAVALGPDNGSRGALLRAWQRRDAELAQSTLQELLTSPPNAATPSDRSQAATR